MHSAHGLFMGKIKVIIKQMIVEVEMVAAAGKRGGKRAGAGRKPNYFGHVDAVELLASVQSTISPLALKALFDEAMVGDILAICRLYRLFWRRSQAILAARAGSRLSKTASPSLPAAIDLFGAPPAERRQSRKAKEPTGCA